MTGTLGQAVQPRCLSPECTSDCAIRPTSSVPSMRQARRVSALVVATGVGVIFLGAVAVIPGSGRDRRGAWALQRVSRWVLRAVGVRLVVTGAPRSGPSLVVGNHISWLDILALSASAPMRMVAKSEVGTWPIVGGAARRTGTLFLQRDRLRELPDAVAAMTAALRSGARVQVFPEGTTRCGGAVNPFRRAAFQAAIDAGVVVSPVTVSYRGPRGCAATTVAFVGDQTLADSMRRVLSAVDVTVELTWLPAIPAIAGTGRDHVDRAAVARLAQNAVARKLGVPVVTGISAVRKETTASPREIVANPASTAA
ncbi:1-acyl-sn-glycerol-3-phosphate acyltransferase [Nakamurella sp. UYEF19]|uniref:lysophospholipid acyltransferase family protein n=1 Tax=Nakamurella sp. UYEF19 TaxID=1756392 RepID=UPI0033967D85